MVVWVGGGKVTVKVGGSVGKGVGGGGLRHLVDVEDPSRGLPELLDDAQHEHVRAAQRGEEEGLQRDHLDRVPGGGTGAVRGCEGL